MFNDWDDIFLREGYIHCVMTELPGTKQDVLRNFGTGALLVFTVSSSEGLWGLVSYENCSGEKLFKQEEVNVLRYASLMLGSVIVREEEAARTREAESRIKLMLDATPLSCVLWDRNFNLMDCNEAAYKLFNFSSKEELMGRIANFMPDFQPNGKSSRAYGIESLIKAFAEGGTVFEWMYRLPDGTFLPAEVTLKRVEYKGGHIVAGYTRDLRQIKLLESEAGKIYYDALTGIYNRRYLDENLAHAIKSLSRSGGILSFMIIDVDRFKEYNDSYGHTDGDNCLRMVAQTLKGCVTRVDDFVARYGGEEFAVVLPNTDERGACLIAERLIQNVRDMQCNHRGSDVNDYVTISIGVTTGKVTPQRSVQSFIDCADNMLYRAKYEGRNRFCFQGIY